METSDIYRIFDIKNEVKRRETEYIYKKNNTNTNIVIIKNKERGHLREPVKSNTNKVLEMDISILWGDITFLNKNENWNIITHNRKK